MLISSTIFASGRPVHLDNIFTWLNAPQFIPLFQKLMRQLFKFDHYSLLTNEVYALVLQSIVGLRVVTTHGAAS